MAETYAYCLLRNHFHVLVRIRTEDEQEAYAKTLRVSQTLRVSPRFQLKNPSQQFSNLFNSYAKAINKAYNRSGSLFKNPFGRVEVASDAHFISLVTYIHQNPQKHGFVADFRTWPYSSYRAFLSTKPTHLKRDEVLAWFGGLRSFEMTHQQEIDECLVAPFVGDDLY